MNALDANIPFAIYFLALLAFVGGHLWQRSGPVRLGLMLLWAGFLTQTVLLGLRWWQAGRAPMSNTYESLLVFSWGLVAIYLAYARIQAGLAAWAAAAALSVVALASLMDPSIRPLMPALRSNWLLFHVSVTMLAYGAFLLSAVAGAAYLVRRRRTEPASQSDLAGFIYRSASLGFLLLTGGIILGSVWANQAWGGYWSWDPKETWSLITWIYYAALIHLWRTKGWHDRRLAWMAVGGMAVVMFTYFGVNYLLAGLHSYGA